MYPKEVQKFLDSIADMNPKVLEVDRYENTIEVIYTVDMIDGSRRTRSKYIRVSRENQMSDTTV